MIQRIQTIWLLISAISSGFIMNGGITNYIGSEGQKYFTGFSGIYKLTDSGNEQIAGSVSLSAIIILILILSVVTILFFKSRRIQKILAFIMIVLSLCLIIQIIYYSYILINNYGAELVPGVKMVFPVIILLAAILSYKGIARDERLVKSYDRLR